MIMMMSVVLSSDDIRRGPDLPCRLAAVRPGNRLRRQHVRWQRGAVTHPVAVAKEAVLPLRLWVGNVRPKIIKNNQSTGSTLVTK